MMDNYAVCGCCCHLMRFAVVSVVGTFLNICGVVKTIGGGGGDGYMYTESDEVEYYTYLTVS